MIYLQLQVPVVWVVFSLLFMKTKNLTISEEHFVIQTNGSKRETILQPESRFYTTCVRLHWLMKGALKSKLAEPFQPCRRSTK